MAKEKKQTKPKKINKKTDNKTDEKNKSKELPIVDVVSKEEVSDNITTNNPVAGRIILIIFIVVFGVLSFIRYQNNQIAHNKLVLDSLVTKGSGLYEDSIDTGLDEDLPYSSKYYFRGSNVDNYLIYDNKCFRIINIAQNNALKVMYIGDAQNETCENIVDKIAKIKWDDQGLNIWAQSSIKTYLDKWMSNIDDSLIIKDATWYIGGLRFNSEQSLAIDIENERKTDLDDVVIYNGMVGLINASDYMKAAERLCSVGAFNDQKECGLNNYLNTKNFWTINKTYNDNERSWVVENGIMQSKYTSNEKFNAYPVVYLEGNIKLIGNGTIAIPYQIRK
ncbi:MAG: hypothetical protein PHG18_00460 [Bacilli bacterium]|nr:hypothetical protein [Bacilli bacterium]